MADTLITDRRSSPAIYKTIRRLGKGGMAEVFLARQEGVAGFRRLAVVKRLLPQFSTVSNVAEMLLDEARIAAQLNHPNIVQIYELGEEDGQYFIAMEYVDGCDLATLARIERRRKSRIPMRLALRVLSEAAMGLDYAHRQVGLDGRPLNLVHRDVSPHNVLCSREGAVKVTDFGIAKAVGKVQVTEVGVVKGKVHYMSPEQYTGGDVDKRSDIFSLGVVLYQLTTGRLPRVSKNGQVNMRQVTEGRIPRPSEIRPDYPEELDEIVMRALAHHPDDRYQDCASLRDDLLDFARQHDLLAFPNELGDYVNALVPPQPLLDDTGETDAPDKKKARKPLMAVPSVTVNPPATERVEVPRSMTPKEQRRLLRTEDEVDSDTEIPIESDRPTVRGRTSQRAVLTNEGFTPPRGLAPIDPKTRRKPSDEVEARADRYHAVEESQVEAEEEQSSRRAKRGSQLRRLPRRTDPIQLPTPEKPRVRVPMSTQVGRRLLVPKKITSAGLAISVAVALLLVVVVVLLFVTRDSSPPPEGLPVTNLSRPAAGEIDVLSEPAKATVFVDGAQRCQETPCRVSGLPLGRELVVTVRGGAGYDLWVQRVVLSLEQSRLMLKASLSKTTNAAKAKAVAKKTGKSGSGTSGKKPSTKAGASKSVAKASTGGSKPRARAARSGRGRRGKGKVVSVKIGSPQALLAVDVRPGWAEIWVDGQRRGHTPLQFEVAPGSHTVQLKNTERNFNVSYRVRAKKGTKIKITDKLDVSKPVASSG